MLSPEWNRRLRGRLLCLLLGLFVLIPLGNARAQSVIWGGTSANSLQGVLNAALIPTTTGTTPVVYTNVNGQGYDIVVTTKGLIYDGADNLPWDGTPGWWFEGATASAAGDSIPYSTVTFRFYQTGTTIPFGVTGLDFRLEDAETGERFRNFSYWDAHGNNVPESYLNSCVFSYASGAPVSHLSDGSIDTGSPYEPGTQEYKWLDTNLSPLAVSGFTFQPGRYDSNYGSVVMTQLGENVVPTTEILIESGTNQNISAGPNFLSVSSGSNAILTSTSVIASLAGSNVSVTTGGPSQDIVLYNTISSGSGNSLSMTATQNIVPCMSLITLSSTTGSAGAISLTAAGTVQVGDLETVSTVGSGGAITILAGTTVTTGTIDTDGTVLGGPGNISVTATNSIQIDALYDNSGSPAATEAILTAPSIALGEDGAVAANIQGSLYLEEPPSSSGATAAISGTLTGTGGLVVDTGTGTVTLDSNATYTGPTQVLSGILDPQGNSLAGSDVYLDGTGAFSPGVQVTGGYVTVKSLTVATDATLDIVFSDGNIQDQVQVTGSANLNGIFNFTLPGDFIPELGESFQVMTFSSVSGNFGSYQGVRIGDIVLQPTFSGTNMTLVATEVASGADQPLQTVPDGGIFVPAGGYYDGLITTSTNSSDLFTAATIIEGTASQDTTVTMSIDDSGTSGLAIPGLNGVTLDINGTGSDKYVIQLDYNEADALAAVGDERNLFIASSDGSSPFENAVFANTDLPGEPNDPTEVIGVYNPATDYHLGYYGVDTVNNRVWAVLDHNSSFGLGTPSAQPSATGPAPATEPASHIMATSCTLNSEVAPDGYATSVVFEFGTDPALAGAAVISGTCLAATDTGFMPVSSPITGLSPNTPYYFRVDGISTSGTQYGSILTFTTPAQPAVTVTAAVPDAYDLGPAPGLITFCQSGSSEICVQYTMGGTAADGTRYRFATGPLTIPAGSTSRSLEVMPITGNAALGNQTATVTIQPNANYTLGLSGSATVTIHDTPANLWKLSWFGANANTPSIGGDTAVNNSVGVVNLMAYGLGLNPAAPPASGLPAPSCTMVSGSGYLALNFTRNASATDLTYTVQSSSDLVNWTSIGTYTGGAWSPGNNILETGTAPTINVQAWDTIPESAASQHFLRLQVTH